jgi:hypothetical protein
VLADFWSLLADAMPITNLIYKVKIATPNLLRKALIPALTNVSPTSLVTLIYGHLLGDLYSYLLNSEPAFLVSIKIVYTIVLDYIHCH